MLGRSISQILNTFRTSEPIPCKFYHNLGPAFREACRQGDLDVMDKIWKTDQINIHEHDEMAFRIACKEGHLDIGKKIYGWGKEKESPVNIHALDEWAFRASCRYGHTDIADQLIRWGKEEGVPINHNANRRCVFRIAEQNNNQKVLNFVNSIE